MVSSPSTERPGGPFRALNDGSDIETPTRHRAVASSNRDREDSPLSDLEDLQPPTKRFCALAQGPSTLSRRNESENQVNAASDEAHRSNGRIIGTTNAAGLGGASGNVNRGLGMRLNNTLFDKGGRRHGSGGNEDEGHGDGGPVGGGRGRGGGGRGRGGRGGGGNGGKGRGGNG
ncbi:hypothetical protein CPB86DRAFT_789326, partial [Serendipita vermifera]